MEILDNNYGDIFSPKSLKELLDYVKDVIFDNYYVKVDNEFEYNIVRKCGFPSDRIFR